MIKGMDLIVKTLLLFLISCIAITIQNTHTNEKNVKNNKISNSYKVPNNRLPRFISVYKRKPGPIRQVFGLIYEQWNDTKYTINTINNLINNNFLPENATTTTTTSTTPNPNADVSTEKPPPYRITRSELYKILRKNLRGLMRLYNLELADALKQSRVTEREHQRNVSKEISRFL